MTEVIIANQIFICSRCGKNRIYGANGICKVCYTIKLQIEKHLNSPLVPCACGCDELIHSIGISGISILYKRGHGRRGHSIQELNTGRKLQRGYWYIKRRNHKYCPKSGYIAEHRYIMECQLGRYLTKEEVVHHIDGNKKNNNISNLELIDNNIKHLKEKHTLDMSKRICITCGSKKTRLVAKTGRPFWLRHPILKNEHECSRCHEKRRVRLFGRRAIIYNFFKSLK